jgi:uncharacterized protein YkwD
MAELGYFSVTAPDGTSAADRYRAANIHCQNQTENLWRGSFKGRPSEAVVAERAVSEMMGSETTRRNILDSKYTSNGIGVGLRSSDEDYKVYVVQELCG